MIHVAIHLPEEALLGGPYSILVDVSFEVQKKLKNYVRNKAKPEGSIAEGYVAEEALTFCSRYLKDDVETRFNRLGRNDDGLPEEEPNKFQVFWSACKLTGRMKETRLTTDVRQAVVWFVLNNSPEVDTDILAYREILSINSESTEVDAPPVNDDNVNANEGNAEDDDVAHVLDDDDDVVVSDDDEVNPSTNVEEMACVFPRSHGGDAGGSPPRRPNRPVPAQCESSNLRIETGNASLRKAFRQNDQRPLTIGFDYGDLGTFHPTGYYASMLNSLMGETVRYLPLACEWEEKFQRRIKYAHIFPLLIYFDLAFWYNNQDKVVMGNRCPIRLGTEKVQKGHYEDLIEDLRIDCTRGRETGEFKTEKNRKRYLDKKSMQDHVDRVIRTRQIKISWMKSFRVPTAKGRKLPGGGSTSCRRGPQAFPDAISQEELDRYCAKKDQERLLRKQTAEAQQRAYLAALKADAAYQNSETMYGAIVLIIFNSQPELPRFITKSHNNDTRSVDELARDKAGEDNDVEEDEQQSGGDYSEDEEGDNEEVQDESEESEESEESD
ncbi:hypothetical protein Tco_0240602 [Tanacetum coccineum]